MYVTGFKHTNYISYTQLYNERHILKSTDIKLSSAGKNTTFRDCYTICKINS